VAEHVQAVHRELDALPAEYCNLTIKVPDDFLWGPHSEMARTTYGTLISDLLTLVTHSPREILFETNKVELFKAEYGDMLGECPFLQLKSI
jgi:hypothetical protein